MNTSNQPSRRTFIGTSVGAVAATTITAASARATEQSTVNPVFRRDATIDLPFNGSRRIAVDADKNILVAAGNSVWKISPSGTSLARFDFERPVRCIATVGQRVAVGIRDHVRVLHSTGRLETWLPTIGRGHLVGDVILRDDTVVVTDITSGSVLRYGKNGLWQVTASRKTNSEVPVGGRMIPTTAENMMTTNPGRHRVEVRNQRGEIVSTWGKKSRDQSGFQGCCNPLSAVHLADGTMITAEAGQVRLKQFSAQGELIGQISGPDEIATTAVTTEPDQQPPAAGLGCAAGGIDLAVSGDDVIWMMHAAAKQLISWRSTGRA